MHVKRYGFYESIISGHPVMADDEDGAWVKFEEYERECEKVEALLWWLDEGDGLYKITYTYSGKWCASDLPSCYEDEVEWLGHFPTMLDAIVGSYKHWKQGSENA